MSRDALFQAATLVLRLIIIIIIFFIGIIIIIFWSNFWARASSCSSKLEAVLLPLCNLKLCLCFAPALKLYKSFTPNQTNTNTNKNTNTSIFTNIFGLKLPQGWDTCCKDSQWQRSISSILSFNFPPHNLIPSFFCGKKNNLSFNFFPPHNLIPSSILSWSANTKIQPILNDQN